MLFLLAILVPTAAFGQRSYDEGGYADRHSVVAGSSIAFHIATTVSPFSVEIINTATPGTVIQTIGGLMSQRRDCTGRWENGCAWPVTHVFTVPITYVPGYYVARFPTSQGAKHILFVVRPAVTGSYAPIAVIQPSNSDVAYNRFGGKSVYDTISDDGHRAHIVSFNRPYYEDSGQARYNIWEERFVAWMKRENRRFEVITDDDMEAQIDLSAYKTLVIVGHSEYWSLKARQHLENYSRAGGHIAIFGANTMWWQVRVDLQARTMTVYKDAALDPMTGVNNDLVTTNWFDWPVLNPENRILGASFLNAAYVNKLNSSDRLPMEQRTPYTTRKASHWALAGTGLTNGAPFGRSAGAIEVDGALFNTLPNGSLEVEGSDGTPLSYEVLATLPSSDGYATIGMYVNPQGGAVFNGAARDWSYGLLDDTVIQRITSNVLDRLATGEPFAYQPRITPNRAEDRFNTPRAAEDFLPGWRFHRFGLELTQRCAYEGPFGLELTGPRWTLVVRHVDLGRTGLTKAAANVWLNADLLTASPTFGTPLIGFIDYQGANRPYSGVLEWMKRPEGKAVRMASYVNGAQVTRTDWIVLTPGWHSVQFAWESPGMLELNVSGKKASTFNPQSGQKMNALMIEFAGSQTSGSVCMDHLQFRDAFAPASRHISSINAAPSAIVSGGSSTVTVQLFDANSHPLVNGGDTVTLTTNLGTLSPVTDLGDGTYTATFTPGASSGTATIRGTVNGQSIVDTATVVVTPQSPPAAPTALSATAISATRIDLSWTDNASSETGFRIERCTGAGCTSFAAITTTPANATTYSDTTVVGNTTYVYRVFAVNPNGDSAASNSASATTPAGCTPPSIQTQPQSQSITSGQSATLSVGASGTSLSYEWFTGSTSVGTGSSITVSPTTTTTYFVRVTNSCGTVDSATATVTVCTPPSIQTQPQSQSITSGQSATLSVGASGTSLSYEWFTGSTSVGTGPSITVSPSTTTSYFVRITGSCGTIDSAVATVAVCTPPSIQTQPQSANIVRGASTTLSVGASGTGLTYQWFAGSTAIGTGSSITVSPTSTTTYFVRVTGSCGTIDSATATVTVREPGSSFYVITPCRVLDTRYRGPALASGQTRVVQITGACGVPAGATAVAVNVTAVAPTTTGFLSLYPTGIQWPGTTSLNYRAAKTRASSSIITLSNGGQTTVLNSGATLNFIIDVTGYFQ
ncbi:MAG TPA: N,N-dimethylformamidase beta subunit family domain-containing protein [Thermoanaerobaculia bacterium]